MYTSKNSFDITFNTSNFNKEYNIDKSAEDLISKIDTGFNKKNKHLKAEILNAINKFPDVPVFKEMLYEYYCMHEDEKNSLKSALMLFESHPNFPFSRIYLATEYFHQNQPEKIPEILGKELELNILFPDKNLFLAEEAIQYYDLVIKYFLLKKRFDEIPYKLDVIKRIDSNHEAVKSTERILFLIDLKKNLNESKLIKAHFKKSLPTYLNNINSSYQMPKLEEKKLFQLYHQGFQIEYKFILNILETPVQILVKDLCSILKNSINSFEHYKSIEWNTNTHSFPIHAMLLLMHLRTEEALDIVLDVLRQSKESIEFWYGDFLTSYIWMVLFELGKNKLEDLKRYLFEESNYTFARSEICRAVFQIACHYPDRKEEVINWFQSALNFFLENPGNKKLIDEILNGIIVSYLGDLKAKELELLICSMYENEIVDPEVPGDLEDAVRALYEDDEYNSKEIIPSLKSIYSLFAETEKTDFNRQKKIEKSENLSINEYPELPAEYRNIGRNQLCPCGSGLKFKKCHGKS